MLWCGHRGNWPFLGVRSERKEGSRLDGLKASLPLGPFPALSYQGSDIPLEPYIAAARDPVGESVPFSHIVVWARADRFGMDATLGLYIVFV